MKTFLKNLSYIVMSFILIQTLYYVGGFFPHLTWVKVLIIIAVILPALVVVVSLGEISEQILKGIDKENWLAQVIVLSAVFPLFFGIVETSISKHFIPDRSHLSPNAVAFLEKKEQEQKLAEEKAKKQIELEFQNEKGMFALEPIHSTIRIMGVFNLVQWSVTGAMGITTGLVSTSQGILPTIFKTNEDCQNVIKIFNSKSLRCEQIN